MKLEGWLSKQSLQLLIKPKKKELQIQKHDVP